MADVPAPAMPLADAADAMLATLAHVTGSAAIAAIDGTTLLGERAMLNGMTIPARVSAGGGCRLIAARGDAIALNLARSSDREMLPALFEDGALDPDDDAAIARCVARHDAGALVPRGRQMGLAIAAVDERHPVPSEPATPLAAGLPASAARRHRPRVLDLSALWAGPLAAHLLWLAGSAVIKVESRTRPDAMREGQPAFYALLNQGKASVALDLRDAADRQALHTLIADADIVIESARPRALAQSGIDAAAIVAAVPGLVWLTITAHGAIGDAAHWVGFGDDVGVAAGLSGALRAATGRIGFVGDAIADPLTGLRAALLGWEMWQSGRGGRYGLAMRDVAAVCLREQRDRDPLAWRRVLTDWATGAGAPFPAVLRRRATAVPDFGSDGPHWHGRAGRC
jgi:hypothetical protein